LVRTDADGFWYFVGRRSAMIKTAGANVSAAEVEKVITKVTGAEAHVVGIPDAERGELVAAVVVQPGLDEAALRARLKEELSSYKIPRRFVTVPRADLPLLSSGKVDTQQLKSLFDV
jgi:acyl-CoA synthetase (AMP-forming)/AMP-acid ligase II